MNLATRQKPGCHKAEVNYRIQQNKLNAVHLFNESDMKRINYFAFNAITPENNTDTGDIAKPSRLESLSNWLLKPFQVAYLGPYARTYTRRVTKLTRPVRFVDYDRSTKLSLGDWAYHRLNQLLSPFSLLLGGMVRTLYLSSKKNVLKFKRSQTPPFHFEKKDGRFENIDRVSRRNYQVLGDKLTDLMIGEHTETYAPLKTSDVANKYHKFLNDAVITQISARLTQQAVRGTENPSLRLYLNDMEEPLVFLQWLLANRSIPYMHPKLGQQSIDIEDIQIDFASGRGESFESDETITFSPYYQERLDLLVAVLTNPNYFDQKKVAKNFALHVPNPFAGDRPSREAYDVIVDMNQRFVTEHALSSDSPLKPEAVLCSYPYIFKNANDFSYGKSDKTNHVLKTAFPEAYEAGQSAAQSIPKQMNSDALSHLHLVGLGPSTMAFLEGYFNTIPGDSNIQIMLYGLDEDLCIFRRQFADFLRERFYAEAADPSAFEVEQGFLIRNGEFSKDHILKDGVVCDFSDSRAPFTLARDQKLRIQQMGGVIYESIPRYSDVHAIRMKFLINNLIDSPDKSTYTPAHFPTLLHITDQRVVAHNEASVACDVTQPHSALMLTFKHKKSQPRSSLSDDDKQTPLNGTHKRYKRQRDSIPS